MTSVTDRFPLAGSGAYSRSKSALATVSRTVRQEAQDEGIDVVVIEPTAIATGFYDRVRDELVDVDHNTPYTDLYEVLELLHTVKSGGLRTPVPKQSPRPCSKQRTAIIRTEDTWLGGRRK